MANHTPGPWLARELISGHWQVVQDDSAQQIAGVYATAGDSSNARLIAAAPDLLAALESCLHCLQMAFDAGVFTSESTDDMDSADEVCTIMDIADEAIRKAKGG